MSYSNKRNIQQICSLGLSSIHTKKKPIFGSSVTIISQEAEYRNSKKLKNLCQQSNNWWYFCSSSQCYVYKQQQLRLPCPRLAHAGEHTYQNNLPLAIHWRTSTCSGFPHLHIVSSTLCSPLGPGGSHLCSQAEQWNPRGCLSCLSPGCWVSTMCSSPQQYAASLQWFHTQRTMSLPPICSCIQPSTLGPLQRSHIHPSTSVIVQRATNEANYPREPPALVGDALTYIFRFGQHYTSTPHA